MPLSPNHKIAHTTPEALDMLPVAITWKKKRDTLKSRRDSLFSAYTKDPHNFSLAREIKALDDEIADCTHHIEQERRAEQRSAASKLVTTPK